MNVKTVCCKSAAVFDREINDILKLNKNLENVCATDVYTLIEHINTEFPNKTCIIDNSGEIAEIDEVLGWIDNGH